MNNEQVNNGRIDEDVIETILKEQVELGTSNDMQMNRVELNFYCELLSQFRELNKSLENLYQTFNMCGADKLTAYFKEFSNNFRQEETLQKSVKKSENVKKSPKIKEK